MTRDPLADAMTLVTRTASSCRASSSRWTWIAVLSIARSVASYLLPHCQERREMPQLPMIAYFMSWAGPFGPCPWAPSRVAPGAEIETGRPSSVRSGRAASRDHFDGRKALQ